MISIAFGLFGVVTFFGLCLLFSSRYFIRQAIYSLQRQSHRLEALRCGWAAGREEYTRALRHQRLSLRVMGQ